MQGKAGSRAAIAGRKRQIRDQTPATNGIIDANPVCLLDSCPLVSICGYVFSGSQIQQQSETAVLSEAKG
jgi:hypothetical protein